MLDDLMLNFFSNVSYRPTWAEGISVQLYSSKFWTSEQTAAIINYTNLSCWFLQNWLHSTYKLATGQFFSYGIVVYFFQSLTWWHYEIWRFFRLINDQMMHNGFQVQTDCLTLVVGKLVLSVCPFPFRILSWTPHGWPNEGVLWSLADLIRCYR